jgi:tetratricopeptide (TPR) repeat protein
VGNLLGPSTAEAKSQIAEMQRRHKLHPSNIEILHHLGVCLFQAGRPEEALPYFERAYQQDRTQAIFAMNLANCLKDLGQMERVEELARSAYEKDSNLWAIKLAYAESMMRKGKYHKAWPIYESGRFTKLQTQLTAGIGEDVPEWKGQKIDGPLLILGEGGWGDRINYSRFLPRISDMGVQYACIIDAGCNPGVVMLGDLFNRLPWIDRSLQPKPGETPQPINFTHWTTNFALMAALDIGVEDIPPQQTWYSDTNLVEAARNFNSRDDRPTVGLVWRAGELFEEDRKVRSMSEWEASRLVAQTEDRVHWVNLQYEYFARGMANPPLTTWDHTAAAIEICDLIVTVDTGPWHLANALGRPTWCVLSGNFDWKMGMSGLCPWYPSNRLFRNGAARGYGNSLAELTAALRAGEAAEFKFRPRDAELIEAT